MMRLSVLASSSRGNASVIYAGDTTLMVDAGISALRIRKGLEECGLGVPSLDGIFLTHEHHDHICGLGVLSKKDKLHLYCSRYLVSELRGGMAHSTAFTCMEHGSCVQVGEVSVTAFGVRHDAYEPFGYVFEYDGKKLGYLTDTGTVTPDILRRLEGVDALYVESNYDPEMLENSGRAPSLIDRICGDWGHLSNGQACDLVRQLAHPGLQHVVLGHLSPECNTPRLATMAMQSTLDELGLASCRLHCAPMANRLPWVEII